MDDLRCPDYFPKSIWTLIHHPWVDGGPGDPGPLFRELNRVYASAAIRTIAAAALGAEVAAEIGKTLDGAGALRASHVAVAG